VTCSTGPSELAAMTVEQRLSLTSGSMPCPTCGKPCRPTFEQATVRDDIQVVSWRLVEEGVYRWVPGFLLRR
jgi:hypothetical protein